ncbi:MAG: hypothetical protein ACI9XO_000930 [Paraglaciecola sp.]|jgi:hypothetical protein
MMTLFKITIAPTFLLFLGLIFLFPTNSFAQSQSIFDAMNYQEVLEMTIEADLDSLKNSRRTDDYQNAYLTFKDENKQTQSWKMKLRTRGKFRRKICTMPPLKMKFKKAELATAGFNNFNDMKLVTHCVENKEEAKALLMKEYLAYQMYEELTENSFRTQLVRITYKDIKTGKKFKNWGFLIEDTAQLAARIEAEKCDCWGMNDTNFHHGTYELVALFQYMIGNEDYKVNALKNIKTFRKNGQLIPVPYDFDFSGLVNASYAKPNVDYQLRTMTDRVYLGSVESLTRLHSTKALFHAKEDNFQNLIHDFKKLQSLEKAEMIAYLKSFYKNIDVLNLPKNSLQVAAAKKAVAK